MVNIASFMQLIIYWLQLILNLLTLNKFIMRLQVIKDGQGQNTGVFVPINDWNIIIQKHEDLKSLVNIEPTPKRKLSELAGKLSQDTAEAMQKMVAESRAEWEERLDKQF
jgi:hypothetical protein